MTPGPVATTPITIQVTTKGNDISLDDRRHFLHNTINGSAVSGRSAAANAALAGFALLILITLVSLGNWQMRRLEWKEALIDTVNARAFGEPVAPPTGAISEENHAYLRVGVEGSFDHANSRKVKALTELGAGYWLATPLQTATYTVWVNRGFVPAGTGPADWLQPEGIQRVEGLLRISKPEGTRLEKNAPPQGRWFSFDVDALSKDATLGSTAPFYIDADHVASDEDWPRGGLTVIDFRNTHLVYAVTWYTMAALFFGAMAYVISDLMCSSKRDSGDNAA